MPAASLVLVLRAAADNPRAFGASPFVKGELRVGTPFPTDSSHGRNCKKPMPGLPCGNPCKLSSKSRVPSRAGHVWRQDRDRCYIHPWHLGAPCDRRKRKRAEDRLESIRSVFWPVNVRIGL